MSDGQAMAAMSAPSVNDPPPASRLLSMDKVAYSWVQAFIFQLRVKQCDILSILPTSMLVLVLMSYVIDCG